MSLIKVIFNSFTKKERIAFLTFLILFAATFFSRGVLAIYNNSQFIPVNGGDYSEGVVGQPSLINPIISNGSVDKSISSLVYSSLNDLSESIEVKDEGRTFTVTLKEDLEWSDGSSITSDDVVFTLNTIQDTEVNSPLADNWRGVVADRLSELRVEFSLPSPYVFFKNNMERFYIIPEHVFGVVPPSNIRLSSYNLEPVSSGPYIVNDLKRRRDGFVTEYHLIENENYHGESLYIDDFRFKFFETQADLMESFRRRDVDGFGLLSPSGDDVYNLPRAEVQEISMPRYYSVFFNPKATSMLRSVRFREALNLAIDKEKLVDEVLISKAQVVNGPYGPDLEGLDNSYEGPNKQQASSLIDEIREEEGVEEIVLHITVPNIEFIRNTAEFIKNEWEQVGVDEVAIETLNLDQFSTRVLRERNYESVIFGNIIENQMDLFPFWHSSERFYPGLNLAFYANDDVDTHLENIRHYQNENERREEFVEVLEIIKEDVPAAFLYSTPYVYIHTDKLHGFNDDRGRFVVPSDRFNNIESWHVKRARVLN